MSALLVALAVVATLMIVVWAVSLAVRNAGIIDAFWGFGFVVAAWTYFATTDGFPPRKLLVVLLVTAWGMRLSIYLAARNFGKPEDYRYRAMRERWGTRFGAVSLFTVFLLQAGILWALSVPLWQAMRAALPAQWTALDLAGAAIFAVGLFFEAAGDEQLRRFKADPAQRGKVMDRGLWRYTRHPNYFGDAVVWWGLFTVAAATPGSLWTIYAPVAMTMLLLRVSGVPLLESKLVATRPGYGDYVARTSSFIPWPPRRRDPSKR
jgi:steroid 5-alpha reductase family enzyme